MNTKTLWKTVALSVVLAVAAAVYSGCVPYSTKATEVGVSTVIWSPIGKKGVVDEPYPPGATYFLVPFINDWHTFDTRLQNLEMTADVARGDRAGRDDLLFKTIDGNDISLDVIISYRIDPEKAPMILQQVAENDEELKENIVRTVARSKPRDIFGELNTEEFYIAEERSAKADAARDRLNEILNPYGVIVERVGTRDYRFNPEYQKAIEDKKVADQQAEKFKAATRAAEEEYLKRVEEAKGDIAKIKAEADGEYQRAVIQADAYYEQQQRIAEAIEAEGRADAEGIRKMNEALSGAGGMAMVKLDVADALKNKKIILLPLGGGGLDVRSTDINALLQLYGLQRVAKGE
jgi:regulator of protease activity HflC (stomatin/prohibitin superfamily)